MRLIVLSLVLVIGLASPAWADAAAAIQEMAEQGDAAAQYALGTMYRDGQGVDQDYDETLRWWQKAAQGGVVDAQFALGNFYAGGTGIAEDNVQAYMWYSIAAEQAGDDWLHTIAASNRDALVPRMTQAEVAKAQQLAAEWRAEHGQ